MVRLRGAEDHTAADVGKGPPYVDTATVEIDVADAQGRSFAPAQAGVAQQQHEHAPQLCLSRQVAELPMSQEHVVALPDLRQTKAACRVRADAPTSDSVIERR